MHTQTDPATLLVPLADLLAAFNHRHRNQHRRTAWWPHFNHLRRAVRRLLDASGRAKARTSVEADGLARRARWAAEHVVPPAYVAFTQLTADNQFAPLGLLLLGALARFHAAISPLLPPAPTPHPAAADRIRGGSKPAVPASASALDLGESVSREDFAPAPRRGVKEASPAVDRAAPDAISMGDKTKDRVRDKDDSDRVKKTKKKKKKKAVAGTDFSDLFGSLA